MTTTSKLLLTIGAALALASCNDTTAPQTRTTAELHFLRQAADAPPLVANVVAFWAVRGQDRTAEIWYRPRLGQSDSTKFLEFKVPGSSIVTRADGSPVAQGDSVLITIIVSDLTKLIVDFQPSGLRFAAGSPARLKLRFAEANTDYNDDGVVDSRDTEVEQQFSLWRQEAVGQPWFKVFSSLSISEEQVEADVTGFTGYAIAY